ncbi:hypothetical protein ACIQU6_03365 [Streptomyces sp. NPDC090442]|uniref:hypothetical protein n=1 Tax=Streptomyces sp. NPDC090442 TaxID=3365962 RepID=UPI0038145C9F
MATHRVYTALLSVSVPRLGEGNRLTWDQGPILIGSLLREETIRHCTELSAVLRVQAPVVARFLGEPALYDGFRFLAHERCTGALVGWSEWYASPETGAYLPYPGGLFDACEYGQHAYAAEVEETAAPMAA